MMTVLLAASAVAEVSTDYIYNVLERSVAGLVMQVSGRLVDVGILELSEST